MNNRDIGNNFIGYDGVSSGNLEGDGCGNCMHNPRYKAKKKGSGKPSLTREVFEREFEKLISAYEIEVSIETHDIYWEHLAYTFMNDEEFVATVYKCIDELASFPTVAEILSIGLSIKHYPKW